jgi:pimeloyl-ACP methyl ester carboxylesterase
MSCPHEFVLPRPGQAPTSSQPPIPAPFEAAFIEAFGRVLPPAKYLKTVHGKAAYYEISPTPNHSPGCSSSTPDRVLFIHGVQTPAIGMLPLVRDLQKSFAGAHFIMLDLWGHGLSETPVVPFESSLFHQLLDALLDELTWSSTHLVGFSFGGVLTAGYVASRTSRVQSFTIVAPAGLIHAANFTDEERGHLRGGDEAAAQKWVLEFLEGGELIVPVDWKDRFGRGEIVAEAVREWQMREHPGHPAAVVGVFRDGGVIDSDDTFSSAARSGIPSLIVLGASDSLSSEKQLKELGFANIHVIPQVGHGVVRQRAPEVAAFIGDFWMSMN